MDNAENEVPALSVDPRVSISQSASETDDRLFFLPMTLKIVIYICHCFHFSHFTSNNDLFRMSFCGFRGGANMTSLLKFTVLKSLLTSRVSCPSRWARQNFPAPPKIEQTLSHR